MLYDRIKNEQQLLETQISALEAEINSLPPGKLICAVNGRNYKWYLSDGHTPVYLPKKNLVLAEQLARKKYLLYQQEDLTNQKSAVDQYLEHYIPASNQAEKLLTDHPEFHRLLSPYFQPLSQELSEWIHAPFEQNPKHPEHLIHKSISGHCVRSKSEALIDTAI